LTDNKQDAFVVGAKIKCEGQKGIDEGVNLGNLGILLGFATLQATGRKTEFTALVGLSLEQCSNCSRLQGS